MGHESLRITFQFWVQRSLGSGGIQGPSLLEVPWPSPASRAALHLRALRLLLSIFTGLQMEIHVYGFERCVGRAT